MSAVIAPVLLSLPPGCNARWIYIPPADLWVGLRRVHVARTTVAGCQTECGITLKAGWDWTDGPKTHPCIEVCEVCYELITHLNQVRCSK